MSIDRFAFTRKEFPFLSREIDGHPIIYLDSASTTPKPQCVIDAVTNIYHNGTANVHRGVHTVADEVTEAYEDARREIASFLNASPSEIVFTRNSTEGVNIVASGMGLMPDDEVVLTALEHHSNYLPWRLRARIISIGLTNDGLPFYDEVESVLSPRTRLLTLAHVPNTTGVIAPIERWIDIAHHHGLPVLIDASQSSSHLPLDVRALDCDYLVLSGHKLLGPSGIGVLFGKRERLDELSLYQTGGGMVRYHGEDRFEVQDVPQRFEAGTPNIEGAIGLGAAVAWLRSLGMNNVMEHSQSLGIHLAEGLRKIPGANVLAASAPPERRIGLTTLSLDIPGFSQESLARLLCDRYQILVSGGYHCAHILHHRLKLEGTIRISTHVFNTHDEIERVVSALHELSF
ncbi:MAG: Cysteine desulfurase [Dehalococcoidales bacterium]|nr:Cysteine desulfurase [Dehalococcoidales bacterium]